jgi:hypothetical protein
MRLGSLSTRTSHPAVLQMLQQILDAGNFRVRLVNPYQQKTKGEMLLEAKKPRTPLKTFMKEAGGAGLGTLGGARDLRVAGASILRVLRFAMECRPNADFPVRLPPAALC